ncbi:MAG: hypothetical protein JWL62_3581 [Hyphomicrobiales bacterium]|nr:hypothetical protein [Hyphomicrobiales bacterium]
MKIVYYTHSLVSCWNHGNAHFLRGVLTELASRGHEVLSCEAAGNWSLDNLRQEDAYDAGALFARKYPVLHPATYRNLTEAVSAADGADLVVVHEWNEPALVAALGKRRIEGGRFLLLFHDTHHRAVSDPDAIRMLDLEGYDGVLAFGSALAKIYEAWGWRERVFVWHEAADTRVFYPLVRDLPRTGLVWIGNWGDGERSSELERFLLAPAQEVGLDLDIYGVRYPLSTLDLLRTYGARYRGWLPNARTPEAFATHLATVHVPRRFYTTHLPGIPTIRVFEALACGIPLVCAPWDDAESLFTPGADYLVARDGAEMTQQLRALATSPDFRQQLVQHGLATIHARHTCAHRVDELLGICRQLGAGRAVESQL